MQIEFNLPKIEWKNIDEIFLNERNPRKITDEKFDLLVKNIEKHPKMMGVRPVVIDQKSVIRGGNMRYRGCKQLGWDKVPVIYFDETWTEEEMKMFVIVDNSGYGIWDYEMLGADYENELLKEYNIDLDYKIDSDYTNKEIDIDGVEKGLEKECPKCGFKF